MMNTKKTEFRFVEREKENNPTSHINMQLGYNQSAMLYLPVNLSYTSFVTSGGYKDRT